jgi:hypothetical protein
MFRKLKPFDSGSCAPSSEPFRTYVTVNLATKLIQMYTPGLRILQLISSFKRAKINHIGYKQN